MKKSILCFILTAVFMVMSSCSFAPAQPKQTPAGTIYVYGPRDLLTPMFEKFMELHPDFRYAFNTPFIHDTHYTPLDDALAYRSGAPDIYLVGTGPDNWDVTKYTQGKMSGYAMPYTELGIDVDAKIAAAGTLKYIVDTGTRPSDNAVVGLGFRSTAGAFFYRRSRAKTVWGTDDPAVVKTKIGPGWDKYLETEAELEAKGYSIVPLADNVGQLMKKNWIADGKLYINSDLLAYLDHSQERAGKGYSDDPADWTTFGFIGPACRAGQIMDDSSTDSGYHISGSWGDWAVCEPPESFYIGDEWVLANKELANDPAKKAACAEFIDWVTLQCGNDSLQYYWANNKLGIFRSGMKDIVASVTVMEMSDGRMDFFGGQDIYDVLIPASQQLESRSTTEYDSAIYRIWYKYSYRLSKGEYTRDEAIAAFKQEVKEKLGIDAW